jgi:hypothetical protein
MGVWSEGNPAQSLLDADLAQHLHRVRHHLDAGADAGKARGLLVDAHIHAEMAQRRSDGETAHAGADDGNRELLWAHLPQGIANQSMGLNDRIDVVPRQNTLSLP